jgi:WD40 repeat protein
VSACLYVCVCVSVYLYIYIPIYLCIYYLLQGWVHKKGAINTSWKRRWFELRDGVLQYYKTPNSKPRGEISLVNASIIYGPKSSKNANKFTFDIKVPSLKRTYNLYSDSHTEREGWMNALKRTVELLNMLAGDASNGAGMEAKKPGLLRKPSTLGIATFNTDTSFLRGAGISSRLSEWRAPLQMRGMATDADAVSHDTYMLPPDNCMQSASCFAVHNKLNAVAIGSNNDRSSQMQVIRVPATSWDLQLQRTIPSSTGCVDLAWYDTNLYCATYNGVTNVYDCQLIAGAPMSHESKIDYLLHSYQQPDMKMQADVIGPGRWTNSERIRAIDVNDRYPERLLTLWNNYFCIWNSGSYDAPENHNRGSVSLLFAGAWNRHTGTEFVVGGALRSLKVLDQRMLKTNLQQSVAWKVVNAHGDSIRDVSWSPLVPHWIASGGDDGNVNIWDIRFGVHPVRTIAAHDNVVNQVVWSKSHAEILASAGADGKLRLWNLRAPPHYQMHSRSKFQDNVVGVGFSSVNPHHFFGVGRNGRVELVQYDIEELKLYTNYRTEELVQHPITDAAAAGSHEDSKDDAVSVHIVSGTGNSLSDSKDAETAISGVTVASSEHSTSTADNKSELIVTLDGSRAAAVSSTGGVPLEQKQADTSAANLAAQQQYEAELQESKEIEGLLYVRDYANAFRLIAKLASKYWEQSRFEQAASLLKLCSSASFDDAARKPSHSFTRLVSDLSYFIPPPHALSFRPADPLDLRVIKLLKLRRALHDYIELDQYQEILMLEDEIVSHLESNGEAFSAATLENIVIVTMPHEYRRTLRMANRIGHALKDAGAFSNFMGISRTLMYPTIYHSTAPGDKRGVDPLLLKNAKINLDRDLRNAKLIFEQIELLDAVHAAAEMPHSAQRIVACMDERKVTGKLLPATIHRMYLNALLQLKNYDKFFILVTRSMNQFKDIEFKTVLRQMCDDVAIPLFEAWLDEHIGHDPRHPWEVRRKVMVSLCLINILHNCEVLPPSLETLISDVLDQLTESVRSSFLEMCRHPNYVPTNGSGAQDVSDVAGDTLGQIQLILRQKASQQETPPFADKLSAYNAMLQKFVSSS